MEVQHKPRKGRPAQTVHGTIAAVNWTTGESIGWSDGHWHGTKCLVAEALYLCETAEVLPVPHTGAFAEASSHDPVAVVAVLAALVGPDGTIKGDLPTVDLAYLDSLSLIEIDDFVDFEVGA